MVVRWEQQKIINPFSAVHIESRPANGSIDCTLVRSRDVRVMALDLMRHVPAIAIGSYGDANYILLFGRRRAQPIGDALRGGG